MKTRTYYLLFALVLIVFFYKILFDANLIFAPVDLTRHYLPFKKIADDIIKNGELPLWMPNVFCGMPLFSSTADSLIFPFDLIGHIFKVPLTIVFNYGLVIQFFLAAIFTFLFINELYNNKFIAFLSGLMFMFCGDLFSIICMGEIYDVRTLMWVPLIFYFIEKGINKKKTRYFILCSIVMALQIISFQMQIVFYTWLAVILYILYKVFSLYKRGKSTKTLNKLIIFILIMFILGVGLSSIQLLPNLEYAKCSVRAKGGDWYKINPFPPEEVITYLIPEFFGLMGEHWSGGYWGRSGFSRGETTYFGILPWILAIIGLLFNRKRFVYFFLFLAIVAFLFSMGPFNPVSNFLCRLPFFHSFRVPKRILFLLTFSVIVIAGAGLEVLIKRTNTEKLKKFIKYNFIGIGVITLLFVIILFLRENILDYLLKNLPKNHPLANLNFIEGRINLTIFGISRFIIIYILYSVVIFFTSYVNKKNLRVFLWLLILVYIFDVWSVSIKFYRPLKLKDIYVKDEFVRYVEKDNTMFRVLMSARQWDNYFAYYGIQSLSSYHPYEIRRASIIRNLALRYRKIMNLANVKYFFKYYDDPPKKEGVMVKSMINTDVFPRAFLVNKYVVVKEEQNIINTMLGDNFNLRESIVLEEEPPAYISSEGVNSAKVKILQYKANKVELETTAPNDCFLLLTDTYFPGWKVFVNGKTEKIYQADYNFRGVLLKKGYNKIKFIYSPVSVKIGTVITMVSIFMCVIMLKNCGSL